MIGLEIETAKVDEAEILNSLHKEGPDIITIEEEVERSIRKTSESNGQADKTDTKEHDQEEYEGHEHSHVGIFCKNTELIFSIISGVLLGIGFGLSFIESVPSWISL